MPAPGEEGSMPGLHRTGQSRLVTPDLMSGTSSVQHVYLYEDMSASVRVCVHMCVYVCIYIYIYIYI